MVRKAPTGVRLVAPGRRPLVARHGEPMVTLNAAPSELILYCFGRQSVARVDADGDKEAIAELASAALGG
jgi:hypothetical protein